MALPEVRERLTEVLMSYYRDWLDTKLPILRGRTPARPSAIAMATKRSRPWSMTSPAGLSGRDRDSTLLFPRCYAGSWGWIENSSLASCVEPDYPQKQTIRHLRRNARATVQRCRQGLATHAHALSCLGGAERQRLETRLPQ